MENTPKLTVAEMVDCLTALIKDEFIATFNSAPNGLTITFLNGQKFNILVKENL